nr:MAG TPA: hypothetical protein [Caudoviricetes sp.]
MFLIIYTLCSVGDTVVSFLHYIKILTTRKVAFTI